MNIKFKILYRITCKRISQINAITLQIKNMILILYLVILLKKIDLYKATANS